MVDFLVIVLSISMRFEGEILAIVAQVPVEYCFTPKTTICEKGAKRVHIRSQGKALEKRQGTRDVVKSMLLGGGPMYASETNAG